MNSEVKHAWLGEIWGWMTDREVLPSRVRTSEDKVCRKDLCWFVRAVYVLYKLPDVSGSGLEEVGRCRMKFWHTDSEKYEPNKLYMRQDQVSHIYDKIIKISQSHVIE